MKITIAGTGYVGLSNGVLLVQRIRLATDEDQGVVGGAGSVDLMQQQTHL